jgi:2-polyprenyl-3-methyl-5-hydroxy-6-metoxy-1,4-benzoquinol methylase
MSEAPRQRAQRLLREHEERGEPCGWFDPLYRAANGDPTQVQWADMVPNPHVVEWLDAQSSLRKGLRVLDVGCGLGDTAEELARRGFVVTAFDLSPTAIDWCRRRFPSSTVNYQTADLLALPESWSGIFDLVIEVYTLQVLQPELRRRAQQALAQCLAPRGQLLVICRGREPNDPTGNMPWPLTRAELDHFEKLDLHRASFEEFVDSETPPVRRFRAVFCR